MEPYWLFFKTVVHTVISLMSAAAVLFTTSAVRELEPTPPARASLVRAANSLVGSMRDRITSISVPERQSAASLSSRLQSHDPMERARAACDAKKLGDEARPLVPDLASMLADDAAVPADVCGDWGRVFEGSHAQPTSPGEKAAAALVAIGAAAYGSLETGLRASQWFARRNAAWALGAMDDRRAVGPLQAALKDPEAPVRRKAAGALGASDDTDAVSALVAALKDHDPETRANAAWALGAIDSREAGHALAAALGDAEARVRAQAAWALGAIGDASATPALTAALKDADVKVRRQAAWALGAVSK